MLSHSFLLIESVAGGGAGFSTSVTRKNSVELEARHMKGRVLAPGEKMAISAN
ncbi:hypothetical protein [Paenibacillus sp. N3.4]|uniref:hypothetical protein n=1 Tax=Paenibacillus sp. N3.4 TaxID=2603222 RepID=UPI0016502AA5|nr:hypothetical protein [Paenibacillus sp. N3.4]